MPLVILFYLRPERVSAHGCDDIGIATDGRAMVGCEYESQCEHPRRRCSVPRRLRPGAGARIRGRPRFIARFDCFARPSSRRHTSQRGTNGPDRTRPNGTPQRATGWKQMRRGDIVAVDLEPVRGAEANKRRPAVIVSNDMANATARRLGRGVITVVPITSNIERVFPFQVLLSRAETGLPRDSKAQAEQNSLDRNRASSRTTRRRPAGSHDGDR